MSVVAIVPAKDREDRVGATVAALVALDRLDRILVVDDGSSDGTTDEARRAGAEVLRLARNRGKGGAVLAGAAAAPEAEVFLLVDADLAETAAVAGRLLDPVLAGDADMSVGLLPSAAGRGGFGLVQRLARAGSRRAGGVEVTAPLSGQRAVRAELVRSLRDVERFGLETGLNVDAARAGARIVEVEVPMEHRHTGRTVGGFLHRARQGLDVVRSLWPRLSSSRTRVALIVTLACLVVAGMLVSADRAIPDSAPAQERPERVVLVGIPRWGLDDLDRGITPTLDALVEDGALAAMSVRTRSGGPSTVEAYATINAGARVNAGSTVAEAYRATAALEGSTAAEVTARRTGAPPEGEIVVPAAAAAVRGAGADVPSEPGALGDALDRAGVEVAVVGTADNRDEDGGLLISRPAPAAVMTSVGGVDHGRIDPGLLVEDPSAPYGLRADMDLVVEETITAVDEGSRVVVVDPGDVQRAAFYEPLATEEQAEQARIAALRRTDTMVAGLLDRLPEDTLLVAAGLTPPAGRWELTPVLAHGAGVVPGYLHSTSTKRLGLVTLTDLSPTILDAVGVETPDGMIGVPLRYHAGEVDLGALRESNEQATGREGVYFPMALTFIIVQAVGYVFAILALGQGTPAGGLRRFLRGMVLAFASWPLATFVLRAIPSTHELGAGSHAVLVALSLLIAAVASRARRHPLSPLAWIAGVTAALLLVDVSTGANLQMSSVLGYSPHTAARFTGFGNTAFAVLAATSVIAAAIHVAHAPRHREALVTAAAALTVVIVADGAPTLGSDVGGILTLVPVFGLAVYSMSGRRLSVRTVIVAVVVTAAVVAAAAGFDYSRGAGSRTHLGDFVAGAVDGEGTFWTTISRKWATNIRVFQNTIWTWMVPITAVFLVYMLVITRGWRRLLPPGSALRAGILGCLAAGILGWLVNDSGVVVTALAFVYAGPYLTLLALDANEPGPELLAPSRSTRRPESGAAAGELARSRP